MKNRILFIKGNFNFLKKIILLFYLLFVICDMADAQGFTQTYSFGLNLNAKDIDTTSDGGFIFTGLEYGNGGDGDYFLMKVDSTGNLLWHKKGNLYNGLNNHNFCYSIIEDTLGNYVATGNLYTTQTKVKLLVVKYDNTGNLIWEKQYGDGYYAEGSQILNMDTMYLVFYYDIDSLKYYVLHLNLFGDSLGTFQINSSNPSVHSILKSPPYLEYPGYEFDSMSNSLKWTNSKIDMFGNGIHEYKSADTTSELGICQFPLEDGSFYIVTRNFYTDSIKLCKIDSSGGNIWSVVIPSIEQPFSISKNFSKIFISQTGGYYSIDTSGLSLNYQSVNATLSPGYLPILIYKNLAIYYMGSTNNSGSTGLYSVFIKVPDSALSVFDITNQRDKIYYDGRNICIINDSYKDNDKFSIFDLTGNIIYDCTLRKDSSIGDHVIRLFLENKIRNGIYICSLSDFNMNYKYSKLIFIY